MVTMSEQQRPPQHQTRQPGIESVMVPPPKSENDDHHGVGKLIGRVALITGGDSGIGRAVAIAFAREGADLAISYFDEHKDAEDTQRMVKKEGRRCLTIPGDVGDHEHCAYVVRTVLEQLGHLDILINNAAQQQPQDSLDKITPAQLERTFRTNIFSYFFMTQAALPHLAEGSSIINTTSVTAYKGSPHLLDYSSTKGAIVSFTRSLALSLSKRNIRVNAVAPGPIWTPLIPSTFPPDRVATFGSDVPLQRAGQPEEVAPSYLFLASANASYMTGQVLHPNGGTVING
jgi:NAD(P)-dependent dehydrogenase (short-subunit alcohol dehydrogenase family)